MNSDIPIFLIIGKNDYVTQVLNKLPNKTKLYNIYLYNLLEPLVEYGFSIYNENDIYQFKIIICNSNTNTDNILNNVYFNKIEGLINAPENIYIWFNKDYIDYHEKDLHYLFTDNNWKKRIFNHIETPTINDQCNIL
jgi:hypothetical protein